MYFHDLTKTTENIQRKKAIQNQQEHSQVAREMSEAAKQGNPIEASLFENMKALKEKEAQLRAAGVELPNADAKMETNKKVKKILSRLEQQKEKGTLKEKNLKNAEEFVKSHGNGEQINKFAELKSSFVLQPNPSEKKVNKLWNKIKNIFTKKQKPASKNVEQAVQVEPEKSGKFKNFMKNIAGKISKVTKGKRGKAAIIAGIATATLFLFNTSKRDNREEIGIEEDSADSNPSNVTDSSDDTENVTDTTVDEQDSTDDNVSEETDGSTVTDTPDTENEEGATSVINNSNTETGSMVDSSGNYTVKKGDCVWNIAKAYLTNTLNRRPTNAEILTETRRIMQKNNIELIDKYYANINPDDVLDLSA